MPNPVAIRVIVRITPILTFTAHWTDGLLAGRDVHTGAVAAPITFDVPPFITTPGGRHLNPRIARAARRRFRGPSRPPAETDVTGAAVR